MPRFRSFPRALLLGAALIVSACSDLPTAPQPEAVTPSAGLLGDLTGGLLQNNPSQVSVLERTVPLAHDEVVTVVIGRLGGIIRLPRSGLTVTVPIGALMSPTRITVTAPAGNLVGYDFQPHGLQFERPVLVMQDLLSTKGLGLHDLQAVYFQGDLQPTVTALETLPVWILRVLGIYQIEHFSGYAMSSRGYVIATN